MSGPIPGDYYARRLAHPEYRASRRRKAALVYAVCADRLADARNVVDLGAGTGVLRAELEALSGRPVVGIELDRAFIEAPDRTAVADLLELPIADGALDFGIANHVYEHVADLERFFAELARVLAPGGSVYLTAGSRFAPIEPHYRIPTLSWWPRPVADRLVRWSGRGTGYEGIHFTTRRRIVDAAHRRGLELEDVTDVVLAALVDHYESRPGRVAGRLARLVSGPLRRRILNAASPQWFFFARPAEERKSS